MELAHRRRRPVPTRRATTTSTGRPGSARRPTRAWDPDRFFRFRKYWDYSGGIATDLFFHVAAPLNICWPEPQFPHKVMAGGGIYVFKDTREVPDTFHLIGEYTKGHSVVLTSSMANSQHIPGLIRGHKGTIIMVDHGMFEGADRPHHAEARNPRDDGRQRLQGQVRHGADPDSDRAAGRR